MGILDFARYPLGFCAAVAMLAACGGSQPIGAPGAMTQSRPIATHAERGGSWMRPEASSDALLYYSDGGETVYVLSYPRGKLVGTLKGFDGAQGVCSDSAGNVFITVSYTENVIEYAHGGTEPIATLGDYGYYPLGCAVDPVTGNLAVANVAAFNQSAGTVAIYTGARGKPTDYTAPGFSGYRWCVYDGSGNLFVDGNNGLTEMPYGEQSFTDISLSVIGEGLQWDGQYLALVDPSSKVVYRVAVSGSSGTVVRTINFRGLFVALGNDFVLQGTKIVMPYATQSYVNRIGLWSYPRGGDIRKKLHKVDGLQAITLSY
jgi:DNA-binding beta-propeller fold protein YncE